MSLVDEVSAQLKVAMRAKDKPRVKALRGIRAAFIEASKASGASDTVSDDEALKILTRLGKQRRESIAAFDAGGRDDLAAEERDELAVIEGFLPALADEATTRTWVTEAISSTGAAGPGDLGKVMGALMRGHKGELDGKLANRIARELLA